jgi:hypothetical protein
MTPITDMTDAVDSAHQRKTLRQVHPIRGVRRVRPTRFVHAVVVCAALIAFAACGGGGGGSSQEPNGSATPTPAQLQLVAIGDSIPYNSSDDCPGCKGFVDRYGATIQSATNRPVQVRNLSEHNNLTLPELLDHLPTLKDQLGTADIIVVAIAHNSNELNADRPCGGDDTALTTRFPTGPSSRRHAQRPRQRNTDRSSTLSSAKLPPPGPASRPC